MNVNININKQDNDDNVDNQSFPNLFFDNLSNNNIYVNKIEINTYNTYNYNPLKSENLIKKFKKYLKNGFDSEGEEEFDIMNFNKIDKNKLFLQKEENYKVKFLKKKITKNQNLQSIDISNIWDLSNTKQYYCDICNEKFTSKESLGGHKSSIHKKKRRKK